MFGTNQSKERNSETKKKGAIIHIPIKLHEDNPKSSVLWSVQELCTDGRTAPCHFKTGV